MQFFLRRLLFNAFVITVMITVKHAVSTAILTFEQALDDNKMKIWII